MFITTTTSAQKETTSKEETAAQGLAVKGNVSTAKGCKI
jgi:hypothetical protein